MEMSKMSMVFDSHVHIYPEKIAQKAATTIGEFYSIEMHYDGSLAQLNEVCERGGIDRCLVHSVATTAHQVARINDFIADSVAKSNGRFVGFCTMHPDLSQQEISDEVDRIISLSLKGIKLHPDFQKFAIDSPEAYKIYEVAQGRLPILFHTGDIRYPYSSPQKLAKALTDFPNLVAIGAHFGGWSEWDKGWHYLADFENCYVDTSSSFYRITDEQAKTYIKAFGYERVLFGSDYPMWDAGEELARFKGLELPPEQEEAILSGNVCRLLKLDC